MVVGDTGERTTAAISAPLMIIGLGMVAVAPTWPERAAGAALVLSGSVALACPSWAARVAGWGLAAFALTLVVTVRGAG